MERQYIGARYVPLFFSNPTTGDSAWMEGITYEALTVVSYAGNFFTSKKPVPSGIGSPNLNPEYWAQTGNYNAQIESIRDDIDAVEESLTEDINAVESRITNKNIIMITDSYGAYTVSGKNFMQLAQEYCGISNDNCHRAYRGSAGFSRADDNTFLALLQTITVTDPDAITDIFVFGGANDQVATTASEIETGIAAFCEYAKATYPKAKICIGAVTITFAQDYYINRNMTVKAYSECGRYGAIYLNGSENIMSFNKLVGTDHVHPTEAAVEHIAKYCACMINCYACNPSFNTTTNNFSIISGSSYNPTIFQDNTALSFENGVSVLTSRNGGAGLLIDCSIPSLDAIPASNALNILKINNMFKPPVAIYSPGIAIPVIAYETGLSVAHIITGFFSFSNVPNADGSYNVILMLYTETALTNIVRLAIPTAVTMT